MEKHTINALHWIVEILDKNKIPYRIGGGVATSIYGGSRPVNDIDISLSGKHFDTIVPLVKEYISAGPQHYKNENWDCYTLSLEYEGQEIDLTDVDTLKMSSKDGTRLIENKKIYEQNPAVSMVVEGITVSLMHPLTLISYKKELDGEHQAKDIKYLEEYIRQNRIEKGS